ncbi:MAG: hypothetical protein ABIJ61_06915 [bacterium]
MRIAGLLVALVSASLLLSSCSDKSEDEIRSDKTEIARLLTDNADAQDMFPQVWIDTTARAVLPEGSSALGVINPEDYSVEFVDHARAFVFRDSCAADTLTGSNPCATAPLEGTLRLPAKIVEIHDTINCRYHVVSAADHQVAVTKDVKLIGKTYVLTALLGIDDAHYNGWDVYAVARQRQAENYVGQVPLVDSIILRLHAGDFVYRPREALDYVPLVDLPEIGAGERFTVTVFTKARSGGGDNFFELYVQQREDDTFLHEWKAFGSGGNFNFEVTEKSGASSGKYRQIVIELFPFTSLRDDNPSAFGTYLQAITYLVK